MDLDEKCNSLEQIEKPLEIPKVVSTTSGDEDEKSTTSYCFSQAFHVGMRMNQNSPTLWDGMALRILKMTMMTTSRLPIQGT